MENGLTSWESRVARLLLRWYVLIPLVILLSLIIHGMSLDDFPVPVAFVHFFPFSLAALVDQVWNGLWNFCRPTAMVIWRLGYALFGTDHIGYRYILFLLHLINVWLFFFLSRRVLKNDMAAVISGLIFTAHPIHSEVVCLLASMYDASCMTFFLATLIVFDRYIDAIEAGRRSAARLLCLATCVLEILCLGAKEVGIMLPVVMLAYDLCLRANGRRWWAAPITVIRRSLPFLIVFAGYMVFRLARYSQNVSYASQFFSDPLGTARNLVDYLRMTIFPNEMWLILLILLPFAKKQYIFSLLFMLLALVPVLQIPPAERFCYIPTAGYCLAVGWGFVVGWRRIVGLTRLRDRLRPLMSVGSAAALALFLLQVPFAHLNSLTWSENHIPVRRTLQMIRDVIGTPEEKTVLYLANIDPLFDPLLLRDFDYTVKDKIKCEKLINCLFEDHQGPKFFFEIDGLEATHSMELEERCERLRSVLGKQEYVTTTDDAWGREARPFSEWTMISPKEPVRPSTGPTITCDLSEGPVRLLSPALDVSTLDIASIELTIDIGQSEDTTCQLEWLIDPDDEVFRNPMSLIPVYKEIGHPLSPLSAPDWAKKDAQAKVQTDSISIDLGSRTDWVFERRTIHRIAIIFTGSTQVRISAIRMHPPAPTGDRGMKPIIQFHE